MTVFDIKSDAAKAARRECRQKKRGILVTATGRHRFHVFGPFVICGTLLWHRSDFEQILRGDLDPGLYYR